jgi:hypothetical protein
MQVSEDWRIAPLWTNCDLSFGGQLRRRPHREIDCQLCESANCLSVDQLVGGQHHCWAGSCTADPTLRVETICVNWKIASVWTNWRRPEQQGQTLCESEELELVDQLGQNGQGM